MVSGFTVSARGGHQPDASGVALDTRREVFRSQMREILRTVRRRERASGRSSPS
jgi:hypothetical protein